MPWYEQRWVAVGVTLECFGVRCAARGISVTSVSTIRSGYAQINERNIQYIDISHTLYGNLLHASAAPRAPPRRRRAQTLDACEAWPPCASVTPSAQLRLRHVHSDGATQPSITTWQKLERQLGARLLERTPRAAERPSSAVVAERAEEILGLCDRLVPEVHDSQLATTPVAAALPSLGALILPPVQRAPREPPDAPQLDVTIDELMPIVAGLEQGRIDVAILVATGRVPPISSSRVHLERLRSEPLHLRLGIIRSQSRRRTSCPASSKLRDEQGLRRRRARSQRRGLKELFAAAT